MWDFPCTQRRAARMCCLCANEGECPSPHVGTLCPEWAVCKRRVFLGRNRELPPGPSITGKTGLRGTMRAPCSQGAGHRGHLAPGPFPLGPELPSHTCTHRENAVCTQARQHGDPRAPSCVRLHAHGKGDAVCTPVHVFTGTHVNREGCTHVHTDIPPGESVLSFQGQDLGIRGPGEPSAGRTPGAGCHSPAPGPRAPRTPQRPFPQGWS